MLVGVYVDPKAPACEALSQVSEVITSTENKYPHSAIIIAGDFNHLDLKKAQPKYHQQIDIPTHTNKTLDRCYTHYKNSYRALARPNLGDSDHIMVLLLPTYKQQLKSLKPETKCVKKWTENSSQCLQSCFDDTDWEMFQTACPSLDDYTDTITSYVRFCYDTCVPSKTVNFKRKDKPWFTTEVKMKIKAKNEAFKSGNHQSFAKAKYELKRTIHKAKTAYGAKLEEQFSSNDTRSVWQGLQEATNYKVKPNSNINDPNLPDKLNEFYCRFDHANNCPIPELPNLNDDLDPLFVVKESEVRSLFKKQNVRKAAGPDGVPPVVLKTCADQLAPVFSYVFNSSLSQRKVPLCFKMSTIVPVPKKPAITKLNDYRPVALTSVIMKVFERLVLKFLRLETSGILDPHQFAYRENRSVEDAVALGLHYILKHLDAPRTYARVLFIDYSSAFNTIIPIKLHDKLVNMGIDTSLCQWLFDFLINRPQVVRVGTCLSHSAILNTGAPQGCVLSPLLFTLFTNDCISHHPSIHVIKFSDDTTVVGLITDGDESIYRAEVASLVDWCGDNNLELNVTKTKELIIDFRHNRNDAMPLSIHGEKVEQVLSFKFLGTTIAHDLKWECHVASVIKKAHQRMFFLRQLNKFRVNQKTLLTFYRAIIESILTFSISVWYNSSSKDDKSKLHKIVRNASRIIGCDIPSLDDIFHKRSTMRALNIIRDPHHPASLFFERLPSRRRWKAIGARTTRFRNSFFPCALRLLNGVSYV